MDLGRETVGAICKLPLQRIKFALEIALFRVELSGLGVVICCFFPQEDFLFEIGNDLVLVSATSLKLADAFLSELNDHLVSRTLLFIAL